MVWTLVPGGAVARDEGMVTASEIARLAEVGRAAVSNWRRRFDDFPDAVGGTPASPAVLAGRRGGVAGPARQER
ncbi:hypothetical protein GCM10022254_16830 [Actinomadura meridiana]|uniref:Transposase n=1 Tax=Actinomadura meridiana TaxID=559626 RepID=A0ABP8BVX9_9ACTN